MRMNAAVIGSPISHSLSPEIFAFLSRRAIGLNLNYQAYDVAPPSLQTKLFEFSQDPFFVGTNVTVPHKEAVLKNVREISPLVQAIGAANVLHLNNQGWTAHNTDVFGICESLREAGVQLYGANVLIIGAGGAARAAGAAAAREKSVRVDFINRTPQRAASIVNDLSLHFSDCDFFAHKDLFGIPNQAYDVVIHSTTVGMQGVQVDARAELTPIMDAISGTPFGFELIYRPEETEFLKQCKARRWPAMGGLHMLVHQAMATWKIWFPNHELPKATTQELMTHLKLYLSMQTVQNETKPASKNGGTSSGSDSSR